jgi:phosphatidylcholine synthase
MSDPATRDASAFERTRAYFVHVYTASGVVFAFLAAAEVASHGRTDPRWVFLWLAGAVFVDATDGPLARCWNVKKLAPTIDGRTIDDLLDYITFAFVPLLLVWKMEWVPAPGAVFVVPAMLASLLGFANTEAKQEEEGFFVGFPSYWNIAAFYVGLWAELYGAAGQWASGIAILVLTALTVLPVRFLYPNRAPAPWRSVIIVGGVAWLGLLLWMLPAYPPLGSGISTGLMLVSLIFPAFYLALSAVLDVRSR